LLLILGVTLALRAEFQPLFNQTTSFKACWNAPVPIKLGVLETMTQIRFLLATDLIPLLGAYGFLALSLNSLRYVVLHIQSF